MPPALLTVPLREGRCAEDKPVGRQPGVKDEKARKRSG